MPMFVKIGLAVISALIVSFAATPAVKWLAQRVGAMDIPNDSRRVHKTPIPRLGGLAIFVGFVLSVVLFTEITAEVRGILLGAVIIVVIGFIDDIKPLPALIKLFFQIVAALVAIYHGIGIEMFSNPFDFGAGAYVHLQSFSIPVTVIWIVAITNSVNLIDGLDGLAAGVSFISSAVMLVISLMLSDTNVALIMAALAGACLGFLPHNFNPAKIFMGDTGALLLGYILATISILGLFKVYAVVSFAAPFLMLAVPLFDTSFAFLRRLLRRKNPMSPDRGHLHHRLLDMGLSHKQAVIILYSISGALGVAAVIVATLGKVWAFILVAVLIITAIAVVLLIKSRRRKRRAEINAALRARNAASSDEPVGADSCDES